VDARSIGRELYNTDAYAHHIRTIINTIASVELFDASFEWWVIVKPRVVDVCSTAFLSFATFTRQCTRKANSRSKRTGMYYPGLHRLVEYSMFGIGKEPCASWNARSTAATSFQAYTEPMRVQSVLRKSDMNVECNARNRLRKEFESGPNTPRCHRVPGG
jgi:hypothetical protein